MSTIITAALSGFVGALAGGGISLISQILVRKWGKEESLLLYKKELYSEIASVGSHYIGWDIFEKINKNIAKARLICGKDLGEALVKYCANVEKLNHTIQQNPENRNQIIIDNSNSNVDLSKKMIALMRKELSIED